MSKVLRKSHHLINCPHFTGLNSDDIHEVNQINSWKMCMYINFTTAKGWAIIKGILKNFPFSQWQKHYIAVREEVGIYNLSLISRVSHACIPCIPQNQYLVLLGKKWDSIRPVLNPGCCKYSLLTSQYPFGWLCVLQHSTSLNIIDNRMK